MKNKVVRLLAGCILSIMILGMLAISFASGILPARGHEDHAESVERIPMVCPRCGGATEYACGDVPFLYDSDTCYYSSACIARAYYALSI